MLTPEQEQNKQQIYAMLKERKKRLSETDRRSLQRAINSLTNFGNDFSIYRNAHLADVPNTVITGLCHIIKELGFPVFLPREADRYNEVSTLCIQETWNSCLKHIFQFCKFINLGHVPLEPPVNDPRPLSEIYNQALYLYESENQAKQVASFLRQRETNKITHFVAVHCNLLSIVATFEKRGSAHKLLAYSVKKGDQTTFFDIRMKRADKKQIKFSTHSIKQFSNENSSEVNSESPDVNPVNPISITRLTTLPSVMVPSFPTSACLFKQESQPLSFQDPIDDHFVVPTKKSISPLPSITDLMYINPPVPSRIQLPSILTQII